MLNSGASGRDPAWRRVAGVAAAHWKHALLPAMCAPWLATRCVFVDTPRVLECEEAGQARQGVMVDCHCVYVSVGSNLGDKLANCRRGVDALTRIAGIRITGTSRIYRTEPVDFADQDWFINYVIRIETTLAPIELLDTLQAVQREAGRGADTVRFGPRVLDLDILLYDRLTLEHPRIRLPHARMHRRRFVLQPLCDIDAGVIHPVSGKTVQDLLAGLPEDGQQVVEYRCSG